MKRSTHALLDVSSKRQKVELDSNAHFFLLFQTFTCFLGIDFLLVYRMCPWFEPDHPYGFLFSKLAQTCQIARKMFRPYSIMLKQVYFKFQLCVEYDESTYFDWRLFFRGCSYNWRNLAATQTFVPTRIYVWIHRNHGWIANLPSNY